MRPLLPLAFALTLSVALSANAQQKPQPEQGTGRGEVNSATGERFMIATANPRATEAGYAVLKRGGSAMDAAVAVQMVLNLVEPQSSGIGGGAFLLHWDAKSGRLESYDGRETAPKAAGQDYFFKADGTRKKFWQAVIGGGSVGIPGTLRVLELAHGEHGREAFAGLLQPAIDLAESGFAISPRMEKSVAGALKRGLGDFAAAKDYFLDAEGVPKAAGTKLRNPAFADMLRLIARDGSKALHEGPVAHEIVAAVQSTPGNPGLITEGDLSAYRAKKRPAVCAPYRAYQVCGMGPPSSGALTVGQILMLLEHFDLRSIGPGPEAAHLIAEASHLAYADRGRYMADSDFVSMPTEGLLNRNYVEQRARLIDPARSMGKASAGEPPWKQGRLQADDTSNELRGTSHFVIVDAAGNAVSMTTTIETGFGSRLMVRGFLLNNELTDFSFRFEKDGMPIANRIEGGKRPRSSMAPTIILKDGKPVLLIGSPGGSRIIGYVAQAIVAILDWDMDPAAAVAMGHLVNRNGKTTDLEAGTEVVAWQSALEAKGHTVKVRGMNSGLHAILIQNGTLSGAADPRREGTVLAE